MADWTNQGLLEGPGRSVVGGEERHNVDQTGYFDSEDCAWLFPEEEVFEDEDSGCDYSEDNEEAENEKAIPKDDSWFPSTSSNLESPNSITQLPQDATANLPLPVPLPRILETARIQTPPSMHHKNSGWLQNDFGEKKASTVEIGEKASRRGRKAST